MATVLIATPDTALYAIFAAEISAEGHDLLWALDGNEACTLTLSEQPQVVFLDRSLPIFNGFEACQHLRNDPQCPPSLPILILSDDAIDSRQLAKVGATGCFPKTHSGQDVRDLIVKLLFSH